MSFRRSGIRTFITTAKSYLSEAHPHGRFPVTMAPHAPDTFAPLRQFGRTAKFYFPAALVAIFAWPAIEKMNNLKNHTVEHPFALNHSSMPTGSEEVAWKSPSTSHLRLD
jgi:hypothetical protein